MNRWLMVVVLVLLVLSSAMGLKALTTPQATLAISGGPVPPGLISGGPVPPGLISGGPVPPRLISGGPVPPRSITTIAGR
jgi:hypothetical protein